MVKKEFLNIILRDIKELELIVLGMKDMKNVPPAVMQLAKTKIQSIDNAIASVNDDDWKNVTEVQLDVVSAVSEKLDEVFNTKSIIESIQKENPAKEADPIGALEEKQVEKTKPIEVVEIEPMAKHTLDLKSEAVAESCVGAKVEANAEVKLNTETKVSEPALPKNEPAKDEKKVQTRNDKFNIGVRIVNDAASSNSKKIEGKFIKSVRKSLNLNDTFRYRKFLFGGNQLLMSSTIDAIDQMGSLKEAMDYLNSHFEWNAEDESVSDFFSLIEARFIK